MLFDYLSWNSFLFFIRKNKLLESIRRKNFLTFSPSMSLLVSMFFMRDQFWKHFLSFLSWSSSCPGRVHEPSPPLLSSRSLASGIPSPLLHSLNSHIALWQWGENVLLRWHNPNRLPESLSPHLSSSSIFLWMASILWRAFFSLWSLSFSDQTYHVPLNVWVPMSYPASPPLVYCVSAPNVKVNFAHPLLDPTGLCLFEWGDGQTLLSVVTELRRQFSLSPPIYSALSSSLTPYATPSSSSSSSSSTPSSSTSKARLLSLLRLRMKEYLDGLQAERAKRESERDGLLKSREEKCSSLLSLRNRLEEMEVVRRRIVMEKEKLTAMAREMAEKEKGVGVEGEMVCASDIVVPMNSFSAQLLREVSVSPLLSFSCLVFLSSCAFVHPSGCRLPHAGGLSVWDDEAERERGISSRCVRSRSQENCERTFLRQGDGEEDGRPSMSLFFPLCDISFHIYSLSVCPSIACIKKWDKLLFLSSETWIKIFTKRAVARDLMCLSTSQVPGFPLHETCRREKLHRLRHESARGREEQRLNPVDGIAWARLRGGWHPTPSLHWVPSRSSPPIGRCAQRSVFRGKKSVPRRKREKKKKTEETLFQQK